DPTTLSVANTLTGTTLTFGSILNSGLALTVTGNGVFDGTVAVASLSVSGTSDLNGGAVTTSGTQTYTGAVTLSADDTLTGTTMNFDSTIGGSHALTLVGDGVFGGAVNIGSLSVSGTSDLNGGSVTTSGTQTYGGAVTLGADNTLAGTMVTFDSTIGGAHALTVTGNGVFDDVVNIGSLSVSGTSALNDGSVTTTAAQTYTGTVTLGADADLTGTSVTLGPVNGPHALTVAGNGVFDGSANIASLDVSGTSGLNGGAVTTSGTQTYTRAVTLGADDTLTGTTMAFDSTVNGGHALRVVGNGVFGGSVDIGNLSVTGTTDLNTGSVTTSGTQTYSGALTLTTATVLAGSAVTLGPVNGAQSLTVTGNGVFDGTADVASLSVNGTSNFSGGSVTTGGGQTYTGAATLNAATTLGSNGGGNITFGSTVDGGYALTVNTAGTAAFDGAVGATTPIDSLTDTAAATTLGGDVTTAGKQSYGAVAIAANETLMAQTGAIALGSVVAGANSVTIVADSVALNGAWSGTGPRTLYPYTGGSAVTLAPNVAPAAFNLDVAELGYLDGGSPSLVTIGSATSPHVTGAVITGDFTFDAALALIGTSITLDPVSKDAATGDLALNSGTGSANGAVNLGTGDHLDITAGSSVITGTVNGQGQSNAAQYVSVTAEGSGPFTTNGLSDGSLPGSMSIVPGQTITTTTNQTPNQNILNNPLPIVIPNNPPPDFGPGGNTGPDTTTNSSGVDNGASLFASISPTTPTDLSASAGEGGSDAIVIAYANPPPIKPAANAEAPHPQVTHAIGAYLDQMLTPSIPRDGVPGMSFGYSLSGNSALW
ncbi:MAG TPA: hypothetical protein VH020_01620, partial [Stellaceae bacterium]|nr:hypothetical protein [Stellaceae bacterium]